MLGTAPTKTNAYLLLFVAIILEIAATALMSESKQFTLPLQSMLTVVCFVLSYYIFAIVIQTVPVGLAYGIWSAAGVVLILAWGAIFYKQIPDRAAMLGSTLIVLGVIIANGFSDMSAH